MVQLARPGLRRGEVLGLRRGDVHLLADSGALSCPVARAHLHVVRRQDNPNRAVAKSRRQRAVPLGFLTVQAFDSYEFERMTVPAAASSDFVLSGHRDNTNCPEPGVIRMFGPEAGPEQAFFAGEVRIISWLYRLVIN